MRAIGKCLGHFTKSLNQLSTCDCKAKFAAKWKRGRNCNETVLTIGLRRHLGRI